MSYWNLIWKLKPWQLKTVDLKFICHSLQNIFNFLGDHWTNFDSFFGLSTFKQKISLKFLNIQ